MRTIYSTSRFIDGLKSPLCPLCLCGETATSLIPDPVETDNTVHPFQGLKGIRVTRTFKNDLFMRAARGERTPRPPVWLMRQAGRTDPAYVKLKEESEMTLEQLFRHSELAAEISLLPRRLDIDAIIFFQDILTPLEPMGVNFVFRPGPVTDTPIRDVKQIRALNSYDVAESLPFIADTFSNVYAELDGEMPVLGFAGAPLTLLVFMVEGKSFGDSADAALGFLAEQPDAARELLDKLTAMTIDYLKYQIVSGAAAVQLFESAAHLLTPDLYCEFALPYHQQIFDALRGLAPTIMFAREWEDVATLDDSGADILSLPSSIAIADARKIVGKNRIVQGNLDNHLLATGTLEEIKEATLACIESGERRGHIFNLSHGLLRETPYGNIVHMVRVVRES